ncbi:autotransporter domain-containing protein [Acetobacter fabarum]|uniref:autotransporter outer membrane beta-barrel domain-containing protein n=1 Tax=Acetobacter fabarum TaxID=483199 RepID=UPI00312B8D6D
MAALSAGVSVTQDTPQVTVNTPVSGSIGLYNNANISTNLTIANGGSLTGTAGQGVWNDFTGKIAQVINNGAISGSTGMSNLGQIGSFENGNTGTLTGVSGSKGFFNAGKITSLTNDKGGSITANQAAVYNDTNGQIGKLDNEGTIQSTSGTGVANYTSANIQTFVNNGSITGLNAINNLGTLGSFENGSTGTLTGISGWSGFSNSGNVTSLTNDKGGAITSNSAAGVNNLGGSQIQTFVNNGSITGIYAVANSGTLVSFENGSTGTLTGLSGWSGFYNISKVTLLTNDNGGTITGGNTQSGVLNDTVGQITTLDNKGVITGSKNGNGQGIRNAGTISTLTNESGGSIVGTGTGAALYNVAGAHITTVSNSGAITAAASGIYNAGIISALTNNGGGSITSNSAAGVNNLGGSQIQTFVNNGSITGIYAVANSGTLGSFENGSTGTLTGLSGWSGFYNIGKVTLLTNDNGGTITGGNTQSGILNDAGGQITTLDNKGVITDISDGQGIRNAGTISTLTNEIGGSIVGSGTSAALYNDTNGHISTVNNSGNITAASYGIYNSGLISALTNNNGGAITGTNGVGVGVGNQSGGQIQTFLNNGTISGTIGNGVYNAGQITTLTNGKDGSILSNGASALGDVEGGQIGTVNNYGTINGGKYGVNNSGVNNIGGTIGVLNNYGTITGVLGSINNAAGVGTTVVNNYGVLNGSVALGTATLNLLAGDSPSSSVVNGGITGTSASAITVGTSTNATSFTANGNASVGAIQVASGSTLALSNGNTWQASGDVTNNGTIALSAPGSVGIGAGGQFTNNGTLDLTSSTSAGNQMTVGGNYASGSASILRVNGGTGSTNATVTVNGVSVDVLKSDRVQISGAVTLNGGQVALTTNGAALKYGQAYEILSAASGVNGRYGSLNTDLANSYLFLSPSLVYTDNTVDVMAVRNQTSFLSVADTRNGRAVGGLMDALPVSDPVSAALAQLDGQGARSAFNSLSGEIHASARTALVQDSFFVRQSALDRLNSAECDGASTNGTIHTASLKADRTQGGCQPRQVVLWGIAYGSLGHNSGSDGAANMQHSTAGFVMGADTLVARTWRVGGLVSYGRSMFDLGGDRNSSGHSNNVSIGGYGGTHWGGLNLRLGATYTWDMLSTSRDVALPGFGNRLTGSYLGGTAQGFGELGYKFHIAHTVLEPFANVAYVNLHTNGYHERGGSAALAGKATDTGVTFSTFGGRVSSEVRVRKLTLVPYGSLSYRHAFGLTTPTLRETFAHAGGSGMDIAGVALSTNAAVLDTGLTMRLTDRIDVGLSYIGQYGNQSVESGAKAHCSFKF